MLLQTLKEAAIEVRGLDEQLSNLTVEDTEFEKNEKEEDEFLIKTRKMEEKLRAFVENGNEFKAQRRFGIPTQTAKKIRNPYSNRKKDSESLLKPQRRFGIPTQTARKIRNPYSNRKEDSESLLKPQERFGIPTQTAKKIRNPYSNSWCQIAQDKN